MKNFFINNGKLISKILVTQMGMMIFGFVVANATSMADGYALLCFGSVFSTLFYLTLLYNATWEAGAKDKIAFDSGRMKYSPLNGVLASLVANVPNAVLAILIIIGTIFGSKNGPFAYEWAGNMYFIANFAASVFEGMYLGLIQTFAPYNHALAFVLVIFPAVVISGIGYWFGVKNIRIGKFFGIKSAAEKQIEAHEATMKKHHYDGNDSDFDGSVR